MGKLPASPRASFVHHAQVSVQKNAAAIGVPENSCTGVVSIGNRVLTDYLQGFDSQVSSDHCNLRFQQAHSCLSTAIGTRGAVDLLFHCPGEDAKRPVRIMVRRQVPLESEIVRPMRFCEQPDLYKIGEHALEYPRSCTSGTSMNRSRAAVGTRDVTCDNFDSDCQRDFRSLPS